MDNPSFTLAKGDLNEFILGIKIACKPQPECQNDNYMLVNTNDGYKLLKAEIKADDMVVSSIKIPGYLHAEIDEVTQGIWGTFALASIRFEDDQIRFEDITTAEQFQVGERHFTLGGYQFSIGYGKGYTLGGGLNLNPGDSQITH